MVRVVMVMMTMMKMVKMMMVVMVTLITIVWYALCIVYRILIPNERFGLRELTGIGCVGSLLEDAPLVVVDCLTKFFFWCYVNKYEKEHSRAICDIGWCIAYRVPLYTGGIKCKPIYKSRLRSKEMKEFAYLLPHWYWREGWSALVVDRYWWPSLLVPDIQSDHMMQPICCDCSQLKLSEQGQRQDLIHAHFTGGMSASKAVDHPLLICFCFMNCMRGPM